VFDYYRNTGTFTAFIQRGVDMNKVLDLRREALFVDMENSMDIGDSQLDPTQSMLIY
jgi:hypothetical protein